MINLSRIATNSITGVPILTFKDFLTLMFYHVEGQRFEFLPVHDEIIDNLCNYFVDEDTKNLAINIPPRCGKSTLASYYVAYGLTYIPDSQWIYTSYSTKISNHKGVYEVLRILKNEEYIKLFGEINFIKETASELITEYHGKVLAVSTGTAITGLGAGRYRDGFSGAIIIDDPIKPEDSFSEIMRENNIRYYRNTLKSRIDKANTPIICIMQRIHPDDLCGYFQQEESDSWHFIKQPMLVDEKSIWEEKMSTQRLLHERDTNAFTFYSQYQQEPIIDGGEVINVHWFRYYDTVGNMTFKQLFFVIDTALETKTSADYTVILYVGITQDNDIYILDMVRGRFSFPELKRKVVGLYNISDASAVYVEAKQNGIPLKQELIEERIPVIGLTPTKDKYTRLMQEIDVIACGYVFLPNNASWVSTFLDEMQCFRSDMSHTHDDIVDALVYGINIARMRFRLR